MPEVRQVVITGVGAVSAAGIGVDKLWAAARDGVSQIREFVFARPYKGRVKIAAQVRDFDPTQYIEPSMRPLCDPFTQYAVAAADEAMNQAGLSRAEPQGPRTAVILGTGIGGINTVDDGLHRIYATTENARPDPLTIPRLIASAGPATLGMRYGCTGPTFAVASACSSATQAIGMAMQMIRAGMIDRAIVGGSEASITNATMLSWEALRVLTPDKCRPFSKNRNGMSIGDGAGMFILEASEVARARRAKPIAILSGYGTTSDARDPVRPDVEGAAACMSQALADAGLPPRSIDYVNAHGTATVANDANESEALARVFGNQVARIPVSSTKPVHGHGLGAGGALELVITINAMNDNIAPPTINFSEPDPKCEVDCVPNVAREVPIKRAMSNSFAFGGINATLIVEAAESA
ncbi:MAG: beta-ketoacyl-[acyl-carrier-protein] synthase family protein [Methylobacteriaceae bacterium]|nr:beta-ketoacyl-[acyl-carrier-protein] synthase family protein [Methylobacteriaceae bacterium]